MARPIVETRSKFVPGTPSVLNSAGTLGVSLPLFNYGTAEADNVMITDIALASATRLAPAAFPVILGIAGVDNVVFVTARFSTAELIVGGNYLMTASGTFVSDKITRNFTVKKNIVVPLPVEPPIVWLAAHVIVDVNQKKGTWSYTLFNDELISSPRYVNAFALDVAAPLTTVIAPPGWLIDTDNLSYVLWYAIDQPHNIPPAGSLGGFQIVSGCLNSATKGLSITSWNYQTDQADLIVFSGALSPTKLARLS